MCKHCFRKPEEQSDASIIATFNCQHEAIAAKTAILEGCPSISYQDDWLTAEFFEGEWRVTCHWKRLLKTDAAFAYYNGEERGGCWMSEAVARSWIWQAACKFLSEDHSDDPPKQKESVSTLN